MTASKDQELIARLEQAHKLSNEQRVALLKDLERYAARDLYGAARLCKDHLSKDANLRLPSAIQAAPALAKHFEVRMDRERRPVDLHYEQDKQLRQPEPHRQYVGPVVGITPNCVMQLDKETGDFIVHKRASLVCAFEVTDRDKDLAVRYPQASIGGVGLVTRMESELPAGMEHAKSYSLDTGKAERAMEMGR
ncbi:hypothetical protein [Pusillimonas caeni]|uniref:hypothetical protein n=1 Tax=Pusillimonas caeni TaxID=1348472 RepID=UPI001FD7C745|nr:hypothetical protein [Pusillimonas caeni]